MIAAVTVAIALFLSCAGPKGPELAFLAVGQGDSALYHEGGKAILIDTGPASAGKIVCAELRRRGISKLDLVLLSHPDSDHIAALPEIARRVRIVRVVAPVYFKDHPDLQQALKDAKLGPKEIAWMAGPSQARVGSALLEMDIPPWVDGMPDNDGSMIVRLTTGQASALFTGDAGIEEEVQMMKKGSWSSQILKLGHHGSRFSSGDSWLDHVRPRAAIVSCGRDNSYGHPTPEVLQRCATRGIDVYRTDREGTISFYLRNGAWTRR